VRLLEVVATTDLMEARYVEELIYLYCETPLNQRHPVSPLSPDYQAKVRSAWNALTGKKN